LQCRKDRICAAIVSMSSRLSLANEYLRTKTLHDEITKAHIESYMADQLSSDQEHIRKECCLSKNGVVHEHISRC
jgi:hypothetical protein